ncbi:hypothetical protein BH11BAC5_BH11BAC5_02030 [soil metagenome]
MTLRIRIKYLREFRIEVTPFETIFDHKAFTPSEGIFEAMVFP